MKYLVDPALCAAHGRCYTLASNVYIKGDDGYNGEQGHPVEVPPELEEEARRGAEACPESAIRLIP